MPRIVRLDSATQSQWRCAGDSEEMTLICDARTRIAELQIAGITRKEWHDPPAALAWMHDFARERSPDGKHRWVGYISYDLGRYFEAFDSAPNDDLCVPLFAFAFVETRDPAACGAAEPAASSSRRVCSTFSREKYLQSVEKCLDYIAQGDAYQVNLSQRFTATTEEGAFRIYARLQHRSPATYAAFLDFGSFQILSNSPELFFLVDPGSRTITNRPIKGTRPNRPGMRDQLLDSKKDKAELAMIVDLQRNDLGRICEIGSVRVAEPRMIEEHPTVFHGVATITGRLRVDMGLVNILGAAFPCGSVTGCPKIRAMQIIDELEPVRRGPYCGTIGWLDGRGAMQFNVAIRTAVAKAGKIHFSVGGGIVADSDPAAEYEETLVKARAIFDAIGAESPTQ